MKQLSVCRVEQRRKERTVLQSTAESLTWVFCSFFLFFPTSNSILLPISSLLLALPAVQFSFLLLNFPPINARENAITPVIGQSRNGHRHSLQRG
ncbi:hypothetical protein BX661DRAFT_35738 [Kickxella alabastrina]|uniref:uncharacterized protein n=1 Tax=Kickxella alabastrina TaxID=61397 RepID=UPI0022210303|nr:uncharacterized protein BX661DRAFT_35738 [Kickxella alabastrina]KAI7825847.1 hypothetical protein BX661DRAFT_35738 [Kickxella alabastrina]